MGGDRRISHRVGGDDCFTIGTRHPTAQPSLWITLGDNVGETPWIVCTQPVENCGNLVNYTG